MIAIVASCRLCTNPSHPADEIRCTSLPPNHLGDEGRTPPRESLLAYVLLFKTEIRSRHCDVLAAAIPTAGREKAMDHEYQNVFCHSEAHRWIECPVLEQRVLPPRRPIERYFSRELFRETRNRSQRGRPAHRR